MWAENELQDKVKGICGEYAALVGGSALFPPEHRAMVQKGIETNVQSLMAAEKPKIMVYGIYNSGKSTLVNAICRKEVAEVADRPMTSQIAEYDEGRYILIDSPGVNAPIEHEEIADRHLAGCHVILFVISSKGIFEDRVNYEKMWNLINKGLPFYIVLNERSAALPPKEAGEAAREKAIKRHQEDLNSIKRKIIKNLITISGRKDVGERYDVIVLNAKRAWEGIAKGEKGKVLYQKSNLSALIDRIDAILEGKGAMKQLLSPLSAIEELIKETGAFLDAQSVGKEFADKRRIFEKKADYFSESFLIDVQGIVARQFDYFYHSRLGNCERDDERVWEDVVRDIDESYKRAIYPLKQYMKENFAGLGLEIDDRCNVIDRREEAGSEEARDEREPGSAAGGRGPGAGQDNWSNSQMAVGMNQQLAGNIGPRQGGHILEVLWGALRDVFKSKEQKEREEHERLVREVDAFNAEAVQRLEEDIRRRQDARAYAHAQVDRMSRQIRLEMAKGIREKFSTVLSRIDRAIQEQGRRNKEIEDMRERCRKLISDIDELRRRIG